MTQEPNIFPYIARLLQGAEVVWKPLGEVCEFSNTGVDKKTIEGEKKVRLLNFVDVFHKQYITKETPTMIVSASDKKILDCNILKGDVFITPSSEILDEIGYSATAIEDIKGAVYSYHIIRLRVYNKEILHPEYLAYLFSSNSVRKQIRIKAQGITRFGLTLPRWKSIQIPLPPLSVQQEIVRILDKFTRLEAELEAELDCRKRQYEYYRNKLLAYEGNEVEWKMLGEVAIKIYSGGTPKTGESEYWEKGTIPWMSSGEVNLGTIYQTEKFITEEGLANSSAKFVPVDSLVIALAGQGKTRGKVARIKIKLTTNQSLAALTFDSNKVSSDYVYHYMVTQYEKLRQISSGSGTRGGLNLQMISNFPIPLPPFSEQQRIASILDKFDTLVNSISEGLPKEIALRRKQYEYYREKLLTFTNDK